MFKSSLSHTIVSHRKFPSTSLNTNTQTETFLFPPTHQLIQYADIYLAQRDRESHEQTGPEIFIEQEDKTRSSALCQLGLKWPEDSSDEME